MSIIAGNGNYSGDLQDGRVRKLCISLHFLSECLGASSPAPTAPLAWSLDSIDPVLTPSSITSKTWPRNVCVTAGSRVKPTSHQRTAMPCAIPGWSSTCAAIGPMRRRIGRWGMCWSGKSNCRVNYKLSYCCSAESTVRGGVKSAKSIDATGRLG